MRVVVKIGGSLMDPANASAPWLQEVQRFRREGHQLVLVHGGGPMINQSLIQSGVAVTFYQGQRVTTPEILAHVVRVLRGVVNAELVVRLQQAGIVAAGISGLDAGLFAAEHLPPEELGLVGRIVRVDPSLVHLLWSQNIIPVVAPLALGGAAGEILNCNGDHAAQALAAALQADLLVFFTQRGGLRASPAEDAPAVRQVRAAEIDQWIDSGLATEGMVPKLQAAHAALLHGVGRVLIGSYYDDSRPPTELVEA